MRYKEVEEGLERLDREVEERFDKNNTLESKTTQDCHLSLWPIKRLDVTNFIRPYLHQFSIDSHGLHS